MSAPGGCFATSLLQCSRNRNDERGNGYRDCNLGELVCALGFSDWLAVAKLGNAALHVIPVFVEVSKSIKAHRSQDGLKF
jgi:hypothetical protein